jgi:hypothetical protein
VVHARSVLDRSLAGGSAVETDAIHGSLAASYLQNAMNDSKHSPQSKYLRYRSFALDSFGGSGLFLTTHNLPFSVT